MLTSHVVGVIWPAGGSAGAVSVVLKKSFERFWRLCGLQRASETVGGSQLRPEEVWGHGGGVWWAIKGDTAWVLLKR